MPHCLQFQNIISEKSASALTLIQHKRHESLLCTFYPLLLIIPASYLLSSGPSSRRLQLSASRAGGSQRPHRLAWGNRKGKESKDMVFERGHCQDYAQNRIPRTELFGRLLNLWIKFSNNSDKILHWELTIAFLTSMACKGTQFHRLYIVLNVLTESSESSDHRDFKMETRAWPRPRWIYSSLERISLFDTFWELDIAG